MIVKARDASYQVIRGLSITDSPSEVCLSTNTSAGWDLAWHSHKGDQSFHLSYHHWPWAIRLKLEYKFYEVTLILYH